MAKRRVHRKLERTAEDQERIKDLRSKFQAERPSLEELVHSEEYTEPITQGEYLEAKIIARMLKDARTVANMSLTEVAEATGMDRSTISRLENGVYPNTTINTISRLAGAYGKRIVFQLEDDSEPVRG